MTLNVGSFSETYTLQLQLELIEPTVVLKQPQLLISSRPRNSDHNEMMLTNDPKTSISFSVCSGPPACD